MPLHDLVRATLDNLPPSPLLDRAMVVDTLLDMLSATADPEERTLLKETLSRVPRSVVVDRTAVADLLLDLLGPGAPSPN
jgi:hypothetical protein